MGDYLLRGFGKMTHDLTDELEEQPTLRLGEIMLLIRQRPDYRAIVTDWHDQSDSEDGVMWERRFKSLKSQAQANRLLCSKVTGLGAKGWYVSVDNLAAFVKAETWPGPVWDWLRDFSKEWVKVDKNKGKKSRKQPPYHLELVRYLRQLKETDRELFDKIHDNPSLPKPIGHDIIAEFEAYSADNGSALELPQSRPHSKAGKGTPTQSTRNAVQKAILEITQG